ncbi:MAG: signal peptidase I [Omnitrophica WOR_2 bacterium RIFCSPHIGHO2_02_FULL_45_21]|nr:MAG: signal peptidase I [Omnitrophica WOR_2 bacterium RIFCSPHIGHO2_02_FULL_45_21]
MSIKASRYQGVRKKSAVREWVESLIIAFILALFIRQFIIQAFKIPTGSMRTTLLEGDRILVNKFIYGAKIPFTDLSLPALRKPKRGEVIVFIYPQDPKKDFIKRLIALPGETVEIKNGSIYINGVPNKEPLVSNRYYYNRPESEYGQEGQAIKVLEDSYYVLGDNSSSSQDSRYWGFVPKKNVLGKAMLIYWPINRMRIIK